MLSIPKIKTFLAKSLPKLLDPAPSNTIPPTLYANLILSAFFINLTVRNIQFFRVKSLLGLRG